MRTHLMIGRALEGEAGGLLSGWMDPYHQGQCAPSFYCTRGCSLFVLPPTASSSVERSRSGRRRLDSASIRLLDLVSRRTVFGPPLISEGRAAVKACATAQRGAVSGGEDYRGAACITEHAMFRKQGAEVSGRAIARARLLERVSLGSSWQLGRARRSHDVSSAA